MASYTISHTDGTVYTILGEGIADTSLGISLLGQNYHNYGQLIANNFLQLLGNQSNPTQPVNPQQGQLWWNSTTKVLSVFDGSRFKPVSSSNVGTTTPVQPKEGDQWWDTNTNQLKVYDTHAWITVGPLYQKGQLFSGILPEVVTDENGVLHTIASIQLDGQSVMVVSKDPTFNLQQGHSINGLTQLSPGLVLTPNTSVTGTSLNSKQLGGIPADQYVLKSATSSTMSGDLYVTGASGITIGEGTVLNIAKDSAGNFNAISTGGNVTISAGAGSLSVNTNGSVTVANDPTVDKSVTTKGYVDRVTSIIDTNLRAYVDAQDAAIVSGSPIPTLKALSTAINNDANYHINTTAAINLRALNNSPTLTGTPRAPTPAASDSSTKIATTEFVKQVTSSFAQNTATGDILPTRDKVFNIGSPSMQFKDIYGTALHSLYADLAEIYSTDAVYRPGTVVVFGGTAEVTTSDQICDSRIAGVISTAPGYLMNHSAKGQAVALTGKVPCKVVGPVKKGDILVNSKFAGVATALPAGAWIPGCTIGKSLEDSNSDGIRDVLIAVGRF